MCLTAYEFSVILFDLCLFITIFLFISNCVFSVHFGYKPIVKYQFLFKYLLFYMKLLNYQFVRCLEVFLGVMS